MMCYLFISNKPIVIFNNENKMTLWCACKESVTKHAKNILSLETMHACSRCVCVVYKNNEHLNLTDFNEVLALQYDLTCTVISNWLKNIGTNNLPFQSAFSLVCVFLCTLSTSVPFHWILHNSRYYF